MCVCVDCAGFRDFEIWHLDYEAIHQGFSDIARAAQVLIFSFFFLVLLDYAWRCSCLFSFIFWHLDYAAIHQGFSDIARAAQVLIFTFFFPGAPRLCVEVFMSFFFYFLAPRLCGYTSGLQRHSARGAGVSSVRPHALVA